MTSCNSRCYAYKNISIKNTRCHLFYPQKEADSFFRGLYVSCCESKKTEKDIFFTKLSNSSFVDDELFLVFSRLDLTLHNVAH